MARHLAGILLVPQVQPENESDMPNTALPRRTSNTSEARFLPEYHPQSSAWKLPRTRHSEYHRGYIGGTLGR